MFKSEIDKRIFEKKLKLLKDGIEALKVKEKRLRREFNLPDTEEVESDIKIPESAYELGSPEGIYVKVRVRKQNGELSNRCEYIKLSE